MNDPSSASYYQAASSSGHHQQEDGTTSIAVAGEASEGRRNHRRRISVILALVAGTAFVVVLCFKTGPQSLNGISRFSFAVKKCEDYTDFTCPNGEVIPLDSETCSYEACPVRVSVGSNRFWQYGSSHTKGTEWQFFAVCGLGDDATAHDTIIQDTAVSKNKLLEAGEDFNTASFAVCDDDSDPAYVAVKNDKVSAILGEAFVDELNIFRNTNCAEEGLLRYKLWELIKTASVDDQGYPVHISAKLIRMLFHDIFDYNNVQDDQGEALLDPSGGGDFCLLTPPGAGRDKQFNFGLQTAIDNFLRDFESSTINDVNMLQYFTKADMITMGAEIAVEQHDGPAIGGFESGRISGNCTYPICFEEECDEMNQFLILAPSDDTWEQSDNNVIFNHLGFEDQSEIVAMMGAHTLGGSNWGVLARGDFCPLISQPYNFSTDYDNSIFTNPNISKDFLGGWFDTTPGVFDVDFFRLIQTMPGKPDELPTDEGTFSDYNRRLHEKKTEIPDTPQDIASSSSEGFPVLGSTTIYHYDELITAMNNLQLINCFDEEGQQGKESDKCQLDPFFPFNDVDMDTTADFEFSMQMWCDYCANNRTHCLPDDEVPAGGYSLSNKMLDGAYQIGESDTMIRKVAAFHNDIALSWDAESRAWVDAFAEDEGLFFEAFTSVFRKMECAHDGAGALACAVEQVAALADDGEVVFSDCDADEAAACHLTGWKGLDLGVFDCDGAEVECYVSDYPDQF